MRALYKLIQTWQKRQSTHKLWLLLSTETNKKKPQGTISLYVRRVVSADLISSDVARAFPGGWLAPLRAKMRKKISKVWGKIRKIDRNFRKKMRKVWNSYPPGTVRLATDLLISYANVRHKSDLLKKKKDKKPFIIMFQKYCLFLCN